MAADRKLVIEVDLQDGTAKARLRGLDDEVNKVQRSSSSLGRILETAVGTFGGFLTAQTALGLVRSAIGGVVGTTIEMNSTLETSQLQFATLMGDSDAAARHVKDLFQIAKKTPFETGPIIEASKMLHTFGGQALNTKSNIMLIGDAAAATSAPINELGFWVGRLYSQVKGGQPFGEAAMRLQELAVMTPEARRQMEGLQKQGKSTEEVFGVFQKSLERFSGSMERQAGTWTGVISTLKDTISLTVAETFRPAFETLRDSIGLLNAALGTEGTEGALNKVRDAIQKAFGDDPAQRVRNVANAVLDMAKAALYAAEFIHRTFAVVKLAVLGILTGIAQGIAILINMVANLLAVSAKLPGNSAFKQVAADAKDLALQAAGAAHSLERDTQAAWDTIAGHDALTATFQKSRQAIDEVRKSVEKYKPAVVEVNKVYGPLTKAQAEAQRLAEANSKGFDKAGAAAKKAADKFREAAKAMPGVYGMPGYMMPVIAGEDERKERMRALRTPDLEARNLTNGLMAVPGTGPQPTNNLRVEAAPSFWAGTFSSILPILQSAFTGGGGLGGAAKAIGAGINAGWGSSLMQGPLGNSIAQGLNKYIGGKAASMFGENAAGIGSALGAGAGLLGSWLSGKNNKAAKAAGGALQYAGTGAMIGSVIPGFGTAAGAAIGAAVGAIKGLLSPSANQKAGREADKQIASLQEELIKTYGSLDKIKTMGGDAGQALASVWNRRGVDGLKLMTEWAEKFKKNLDIQNEIDTLNGQLEGLRAQQKPAWEAVQSAAEKYGLTLADLGQQAQQMAMQSSVTGILNDWDTLTAAGVNGHRVAKAMSDQLNQVVKDSQRYGTLIPANMQPVLQHLVDQGLLLDINGKKLTSLAGLNWGEAVETEASKLTSSIQLLVDKVAALVDSLNKVPEAAAKIPAKINTKVEADYSFVPAGYKWAPDPGYASRGGLVTSHGIQYLSGGGPVRWMSRGTDTQPAMLSVGEGVLTTRGMDNLGKLNRGQGVGRGKQVVQLHVNGRLLWEALAEDAPDFMKLRVG